MLDQQLVRDWAVQNNGGQPPAALFTPNCWWTASSRRIGLPLHCRLAYYTYVTGYGLGTLSAGTHTIKIYTDYTNAVTESNKSDNIYTKTITVVPPPTVSITNPWNGEAFNTSSITVNGTATDSGGSGLSGVTVLNEANNSKQL